MINNFCEIVRLQVTYNNKQIKVNSSLLTFFIRIHTPLTPNVSSLAATTPGLLSLSCYLFVFAKHKKHESDNNMNAAKKKKQPKEE